MTRARFATAVAAGFVSASAALGVPLALERSGADHAHSSEPRAAERTKAGARHVSITLADRDVKPSAMRVPAGRVAVEQVNEGSTDHDLLLVRTDLAADDLPVGLTGVRAELAGPVVLGRAQSHRSHAPGLVERDGHAHGGHRHLGPGKRRSASVVLERGRYIALCPLPGHYEAGQRATLVVD